MEKSARLVACLLGTFWTFFSDLKLCTEIGKLPALMVAILSGLMAVAMVNDPVVFSATHTKYSDENHFHKVNIYNTHIRKESINTLFHSKSGFWW